MAIERKIKIRAWEHPVESLPSDVKGYLSEQELAAYSRGALAFQEMASRSEVGAVKELLDNLSDDQPMFVDLFSTDEQPWETWFGFTIIMNQYQPRMRLPRENIELPVSTPAIVETFYGAFGGFTDSSYCGGFMKTEDVVRDADVFIMDHHEIASEGCHFFFNFGNGDYAGWDDTGAGVVYDHELGELARCALDELYASLFLDMNHDHDRFAHLD